MNLGEGRNLSMGQDGDGVGVGTVTEPVPGLGPWRGCDLSRRSVHGRGLILSLGQVRD